MAEIWAQLATPSANDSSIIELGKNAYACKKSEMYRNMQSHAVNILVEEGYSYLLDETKPFYQHLEVIRALPENIMEYENGYAVENVASGERAGSTSM